MKKIKKIRRVFRTHLLFGYILIERKYRGVCTVAIVVQNILEGKMWPAGRSCRNKLIKIRA